MSCFRKIEDSQLKKISILNPFFKSYIETRRLKNYLIEYRYRWCSLITGALSITIPIIATKEHLEWWFPIAIILPKLNWAILNQKCAKILSFEMRNSKLEELLGQLIWFSLPSFSKRICYFWHQEGTCF